MPISFGAVPRAAVAAALAVVLGGAGWAVHTTAHPGHRTGGRSAATTAPAPPPQPAPAAVDAAPGRADVSAPVLLQIGVASSHHPRGVTAQVQSHGLTADGWLFIPPSPLVVAWDSDDAAVTASRGTAIIAGHVNYVIDGQVVHGAFADLAEYARGGIGRPVVITLADGTAVRFRIVAVRTYTKDQLAASPALRREVFDQSGRYGPEQVARLLLVSCGGPFDPHTGEYLDNVFVYAYRE